MSSNTAPISWSSGLAIDSDGSPRSYAPANSGLPALDYLANAGHPGNWWALACDANGHPFVQGDGDPAPGYYISTTALQDHSKAVSDPRRYVDSETVPYVSVARELHETHGVQLGDVCLVTFNGNSCAAVVADISPRGHYGEGSVALARQLGIESSPKHGGCSKGVTFYVFAGSSKGWPRPYEDIEEQVNALWNASQG